MPDIARRIAVTLAAIAVYRIASFIPMPGLDERTLGLLYGSIARDGGENLQRTSILALDLQPLWSALILAELVLLIPASRRWFEANSRNAASFSHYVVVGALFLSTLQAYAMALGLEDAQRIVAEPGNTFRLGICTSLVGATAMVIWLTHVITRYGLGHGFWILAASAAAVGLWSDMVTFEKNAAVSFADPNDFNRFIAFVAAGVALIVALARARPSLANTEMMMWPATLAFWLLSWLRVASILQLGSGRPLSGGHLNASDVFEIICLALILPLFTLLRARAIFLSRTSTEPARSFRQSPEFMHAVLSALGLIVICTTGQYLTATSGLNLPLDGQSLLLLTLVPLGVLGAAGILDRTRRAP